MSWAVSVIVPPEPIVSPADIPGGHAADDPMVQSMILAAQEDIDGPAGWLGRSLGEQTLEIAGSWGCPRLKLPYGPVIEIAEVTYEGKDGERLTADPATYYRDGDEIVVRSGAPWASRPNHRIRYRAGYNGVPVAEGGTGSVPERARQAIILSVKIMLEMVDRDVFETQESIVGVGATARSVTPYVSQAVREVSRNLLQGLRVYL